MTPAARTPSQLYLEVLQQGAYANLGYPAPVYNQAEMLSRAANNRVALQEGGELDSLLKQRFEEAGIDPRARFRILDQLRQGNDQVSSHRNVEAVFARYGDAPTAHVDPFQHSILKGLQDAIEAVPNQVPGLPFADELKKVSGKVTLSTLPTGQVNARTIAVPNTDNYLIVFDPVFFDFLYSTSISLAQPIDGPKAQQMAEGYAISAVEEPLTNALQASDNGYSAFFFDTLWTFLKFGRSPFPAPYDEQSFSLAEHLRHTGALFIAAHEYAHILLGHFRSHDPQERLARSSQPNTVEYQQEFEADWLACDIVNAVQIAAHQPPPVRFMGAHFFFISGAILDLTLGTLASGEPRSLDQLVAAAADIPAGATHPVAALRIAQINLWISKYLSTPAVRGSEFYCALLLQVAGLLWKTVTPGVVRMHEKGIQAPKLWTGFDIFEHP